MASNDPCPMCSVPRASERNEIVIHQVNGGDCLRRQLVQAQATAERRRVLLERLEWSASYLDAFDHRQPMCPVCREKKADGHAPDCALAAEIHGEGDGDAT